MRADEPPLTAPDREPYRFLRARVRDRRARRPLVSLGLKPHGVFGNVCFIPGYTCTLSGYAEGGRGQEA